MTKKILFFVLTLVSLTMSAQTKKQSAKLTSPDGHLSATIQQQGLTLCRDGRVALQLPKVGVEGNTNMPVFSFEEKVKADYTMISGKRSHCTNVANEYRWSMGEGQTMVLRLYNDGIAFRYEFTNLAGELPRELTTYQIAEGTRRWMCPTPTRGTENTATTGLVRIGPNVGPLYEKAGQGKTTYANEFAVPTPPAVPGTDYTVTLPINGVMNPDGTFTPRAADQIQSIKFVYRKDLDDTTLVTNEVNLATKTTVADWGDQYAATIPSSYFPAAGHLMQWKVLITDGEGVEWTSPSFNNKDDGYEWYGTIVAAPELESATLPTWHMFVDSMTM